LRIRLSLVVAAHILGQLREGEMNRRRPQHDVADLVDEFWSLQNGQRTSDESEVVVEPSSDLEMEFTAIAEALLPPGSRWDPRNTAGFSLCTTRFCRIPG
jgi:hypothetical protein